VRLGRREIPGARERGQPDTRRDRAVQGRGGVQQSGSLMMVVDVEVMYGVFAFGWQTVWG
jgi:hypothetical protein